MANDRNSRTTANRQHVILSTSAVISSKADIKSHVAPFIGIRLHYSKTSVDIDILTYTSNSDNVVSNTGSCHKRQKPKAPTPQAPIRNCQTRKVAKTPEVLTAILT